MGFFELMGTLREPGDDGLPDGIYDEIESEYNSLSEGSAAKIADLETALAAKDADNLALKAVNYDLLMAAPVASDVNDDANDNVDNDAIVGIDDLFE